MSVGFGQLFHESGGDLAPTGNLSDGQLADWYLDQMGRLGVAPRQQGYKPSAVDVQDFQLALQQEMAKLGY